MPGANVVKFKRCFLRWCHTLRKINKLILNTSLDMCILLLDVATVDCLQYICHVHCLMVGKTGRGVGVGNQ